MAEGFAGGIEGDDHGVGLIVFEDVEEHAYEAVERVGGAAIAGGHVAGGEERAVDEAVAVDDDEALGHISSLQVAACSLQEGAEERGERGTEEREKGREGDSVVH